MKKRDDEEFGNVSKLIGEWLQSEPIQAGEDAEAAFEDGLRPFRKDRLQLGDVKEKLLKKFQSDTEFEIISKRIDARLADRKHLVGPGKPELELISEYLPTIHASEKPKILAAAIVRALDAQEETDLDGWYVIRGAGREAGLEDLLHVVNTIIYELELTEEDAREDAHRKAQLELVRLRNASRDGGKKGGTTKAEKHAVTEDEKSMWTEHAIPLIAKGKKKSDIARWVHDDGKLNPRGRDAETIRTVLKPLKKP